MFRAVLTDISIMTQADFEVYLWFNARVSDFHKIWWLESVMTIAVTKKNSSSFADKKKWEDLSKILLNQKSDFCSISAKTKIIWDWARISVTSSESVLSNHHSVE